MAIRVDSLVTYPNRPFGHLQWAHLFDDGDDLEALHRFAARIGLKRAWFQNHHRHEHYDVTAGMHRRALKAGATLIAGDELRAYYRARADGVIARAQQA